MDNSKNKVVLLTSEFPPLPGGIGNHAMNLALALHKEGKEVTVMAEHRSGNVSKELDFDATLPFEVFRLKRRKLIAVTYFERIGKAVRLVASKNEVVASGKFSLWTAGFLSCIYPSKKYIAVLHGSELNAGGKYSKKFTKWSLGRFHYLIAVSNFTKNIALKINPDLNIHVINNGVSFRKEMDFGIEKDKTLSLITVGNVTFRKGQQNVIKALPLLQLDFPDVHYHVVGIPTKQQNFEDLAKELCVSERVTFHGALPNELLAKKLSEAKVFMMLSDHLPDGDVEGFGIAVLEANQLGLPAIGSCNSGIADAIKNGYSGQLVNPHDAEEIGNALHKILTDYENYASNAKEWAKRFDWDIVGKKYIEIIG